MGIKYILILIISLSIIYYKFNDLFKNIENYADFNSFKYLNDNIGVKLTLPVKYDLKIGIDNVYTYKKIADVLSYYGGYSIDKNDNMVTLIKKVENSNLDFGIVQEDIIYNFLNRYLESDNTEIKNTRGICSIYFEYLLFMLNNSIKKSTIEELKIGPRNFLIATELEDTSSNYYFKKIFRSFNFKLVKVDSISSYKEKRYLKENNTVYYITRPKNKILNFFLQDQIDGIFLLSNFSDISLRNLLKIKMVRFIPTSTEKNRNDNNLIGLYNKKLNTSFFYESGSSNYIECSNNIKMPPISMKSKNINSWKLTEEERPMCWSQEIIDVKASRVILITNKNVKEEDVYNFSKLVFNSHKVIKNKVSQLNETSYLNLGYADDFIPNEMSYVVKDIKLHKGAYKFLYELGYITDVNHPKCVEFIGKSKCLLDSESINRYKYYWKYKKIGMSDFEIDKY